MSETPPSWTETVVRATLAAVPYVGGSLQVLYEDVATRRAGRAGQTMARIAAAAGEDVLAGRLAEDEVLEALFVNAVDAATRTGLEAKRRLLARAVADAVADEAKVDEAQLLVAALAELDVVHVKALVRLAREWDMEQAKHAADPGSYHSLGTSHVWWELHVSVRSALKRTGTGTSGPGTHVMRSYPVREEGITDFGIELLESLRQEGSIPT